MDAQTRAVELLNLVTAFVEQNNYESGELTYDEADCDGQCFANDCATAAEELERATILPPDLKQAITTDTGSIPVPASVNVARDQLLASISLQVWDKALFEASWQRMVLLAAVTHATNEGTCRSRAVSQAMAAHRAWFDEETPYAAQS
jgi:hypothetical protein